MEEGGLGKLAVPNTGEGVGNWVFHTTLVEMQNNTVTLEDSSAVS